MSEAAGVISVLIADDQRLLRAGFRVILGSEPDIDVVGEAADGTEAVEAVRSLRPSVVLMDIRMPNMDGLEAARVILAESDCRVLILTTFDSDEYVYAALRAGASGFLLKDAPREQLIGAVRSVAAGDALIDPSITRRLIQQFALATKPKSQDPPELGSLTPRERDVFRLVAQGLTNAEIASRLTVEESTAKSHVGRILMKLHVRDRVPGRRARLRVRVRDAGEPAVGTRAPAGTRASGPAEPSRASFRNSKCCAWVSARCRAVSAGSAPGWPAARASTA